VPRRLIIFAAALLLSGCASPAENAAPVDCAHDKCVALTFDDGPTPFTDRLLGVLGDADAKAACPQCSEGGADIGIKIRLQRRILRQPGAANGHDVMPRRQALHGMTMAQPLGDILAQITPERFIRHRQMRGPALPDAGLIDENAADIEDKPSLGRRRQGAQLFSSAQRSLSMLSNLSFRCACTSRIALL
jgi:hypothetical protein